MNNVSSKISTTTLTGSNLLISALWMKVKTNKAKVKIVPLNQKRKKDLVKEESDS